MKDRAASARPEAAVLAEEFKLDRRRVERTIELLDAGNTVWFIARYRKEWTGGLDDETLQRLALRLGEWRAVEARRTEILRLLEAQENLTPELAREIEEAETLQRLDDLYRPFRPKRRTRAALAREKGLAPLARALVELRVPEAWRRVASPAALAAAWLPEFKDVATPEEALAGAQDIVAEWVADDPDVREELRRFARRSGRALAERAPAPKDGEALPAEEAARFDDYVGFAEALGRLRPHQVLALDRGERLGVLRVRIELDAEAAVAGILKRVRSGRLVPSGVDPDAAERRWVAVSEGRLREGLAALQEEAVRGGYRRLLWPAVERELRAALTRDAHEHAIRVFGNNLRQLLMQPPIAPAVVLGIDPGYRAGCKVAVVSPTGELLATATVHPHPPQGAWQEALQRLEGLVREFGVEVIAVGNGTASPETQRLVSELIARRPAGRSLRFTVVNEAGASVYSASPIAREELPGIDVTLRGAVSIARRLQDPLAELVKIDPKAIGVGLYQHDVEQGRLAESLERVVEACVNRVGVELNTASAALLRRVSGLSARQAAALVEHRRALGRFASRAQLLDVPGIGPKTFEQCAGFLRVRGGAEPLDATPIHPESYDVARRLLARAATGLAAKSPAELPVEVPAGSRAPQLAALLGSEALRQALAALDLERLAAEWEVGLPTLRDLADALGRPGRDPREELPPPLMRTEVLEIEDVRVGMVFDGRVTNVVDFGAFVDIGLKKEGLIHVSQMADRYVRDPFDVVSVGDIVRVSVVSVDPARGRIGLSLRLPGATPR